MHQASCCGCFRKINILVVSALSDKSTAIAALKLGARGFVAKPFSDDELKMALLDVMEKVKQPPTLIVATWMMDALHQTELKLFVDSVRHYFQVLTKQEPQITSAFLGTGDIDGYDFNGIVTFSGSYNGHVIVSMPPQLAARAAAAAGRNRPVRGQSAGRRGRDRQHAGRQCPQDRSARACRSRCR